MSPHSRTSSFGSSQLGYRRHSPNEGDQPIRLEDLDAWRNRTRSPPTRGSGDAYKRSNSRSSQSQTTEASRAPLSSSERNAHPGIDNRRSRSQSWDTASEDRYYYRDVGTSSFSYGGHDRSSRTSSSSPGYTTSSYSSARPSRSGHQAQPRKSRGLLRGLADKAFGIRDESIYRPARTSHRPPRNYSSESRSSSNSSRSTSNRGRSSSGSSHPSYSTNTTSQSSGTPQKYDEYDGYYDNEYSSQSSSHSPSANPRQYHGNEYEEAYSRHQRPASQHHDSYQRQAPSQRNAPQKEHHPRAAHDNANNAGHAERSTSPAEVDTPPTLPDQTPSNPAISERRLPSNNAPSRPSESFRSGSQNQPLGPPDQRRRRRHSEPPDSQQSSSHFYPPYFPPYPLPPPMFPTPYLHPYPYPYTSPPPPPGWHPYGPHGPYNPQQQQPSLYTSQGPASTSTGSSRQRWSSAKTPEPRKSKYFYFPGRNPSDGGRAASAPPAQRQPTPSRGGNVHECCGGQFDHAGFEAHWKAQHQTGKVQTTTPTPSQQRALVKYTPQSSQSPPRQRHAPIPRAIMPPASQPAFKPSSRPPPAASLALAPVRR